MQIRDSLLVPLVDWPLPHRLVLTFEVSLRPQELQCLALLFELAGLICGQVILRPYELNLPEAARLEPVCIVLQLLKVVHALEVHRRQRRIWL